MRIVVWALGTGFVTGAVWFAILFLRRHPREANAPMVLPPSQHPDARQLENLTRRLAELEERLDATEYLLKREKHERARRPPP